MEVSTWRVTLYKCMRVCGRELSIMLLLYFIKRKTKAIKTCFDLFGSL